MHRAHSRSQDAAHPMKIAVVTWSARRVGGTESYLAALPQPFATRGHQVALWHETDGPAQRPAIAWDAGPVWSAEQLGRALAVESLRAWKPDIIYAQGLTDPALERAVLDVAPAVLFAHGYYGTCISGGKAFMTGTPRPCGRRFGVACFAHYYPHRCGGLNPLTMLNEYTRQSARRAHLAAYRAIATASEHMRQEMLRHGAKWVEKIGLPLTREVGQPVTPGTREGVRLLFAGRMERSKGGSLLIDALPVVRRQLARPISLSMMGDGKERLAWERAARAQTLLDSDLTIRFRGWVGPGEMDEAYADADLLVVPSVWPEPFGLVGLEAGARGVPAAAFAVGGIPEWLTDGVNGHTAPGDPPSAAGLARAIVACLSNGAHHAALRRAALERSQAFGLDAHMDRLLSLLNAAR